MDKKNSYLIAISKPFKNGKYTYIEVICKCGTTKQVEYYQYRNNKIKSCGCYLKERLRKRRKGSIANNGFKKCSACLKELPISSFGTLNKSIDKLSHRCKLCQKMTSILSKYGISILEYNNLLIKQNNKCACCGTDTNNRKTNGYFIVDHCHLTGKIRGLLCHNCNSGIGLLGDNIEGIQNAIRYLSNE